MYLNLIGTVCVQELAEKNNYTMAEVGKVKMELNTVISKLEQERSSQSDLRDKLSHADKELSGKLCFSQC
jgi:hypothetical protein